MLPILHPKTDALSYCATGADHLAILSCRKSLPDHQVGEPGSKLLPLSGLDPEYSGRTLRKFFPCCQLGSQLLTSVRTVLRGHASPYNTCILPSCIRTCHMEALLCSPSSERLDCGWKTGKPSQRVAGIPNLPPTIKTLTHRGPLRANKIGATTAL
jgi:hypothetical protein